MSQYLGKGDGSDGDLVISSNTTETVVNSSISVIAGSKNATVSSGLSLSVGDLLLISQTRGVGNKSLEFNKVEAYSGTSLTLALPASNSYTDGGDNQAQIRKVNQYSSVVVSSGAVLDTSAWDGDKGGVLAICCSGKVDIQNGAFNVDGLGFRGGSGGAVNTGVQGEGESGEGGQDYASNDNGGGGGTGDGGNKSAGGGGGGNGSAGDAGVANTGVNAGQGGNTAYQTDLTYLSFGGGGGEGGRGLGVSGTPGDGGNGGGLIVIVADEINVDSTSGEISADGGDGQAGTQEASGGGGGAGGCILLIARSITYNTNRVHAQGGNGGAEGAGGNGSNGGDGGDGRIAIRACSIDGITNPTANEAEGGHEWCVIGGGIY